MRTKQDILNDINKIKKEANEYQQEFINNYITHDKGVYSYTCYNLEESMDSFADSMTSIYYDDQREYYYAHVGECERAFDDLGYTNKEFGSLDEALCKAGALGELVAILDELYDFNRLQNLIDLIDKLNELEGLEDE